MMVSKKSLSRRTVLRGVGAVVGLPLLDAMIPAFATPATTPAVARRFGVVYHPNGVIYDKWLPTGVGKDFEFSPTLAGLKPFREQLNVITGLFSDQAEANGDGGGDHTRASGTYLTGVHVRKSDSLVENGISMDQIVANATQRDTQLRSLEIIADDNSFVGDCDLGYSCAYSTTLSWLTPTLPLMAENNPRVLFERMFRIERQHGFESARGAFEPGQSLLDSVNDRVESSCRKTLGQTPTTTRSTTISLHCAMWSGASARRKNRVRTRCPMCGSRREFRTRSRSMCGCSLRSAAAGLSIGPDAGHHIHVWPGADGPALSADRRARSASSADASPGEPGEDGEVHAHPAASFDVVR